MLAYSFDRFYVVTKFTLPAIKDFKFATLKFDNNNCEYLKEKDEEHNMEVEQHILNLLPYCRKIKLHLYFYKEQIKCLNETAHHILKNEIGLILPQFSTDRREKRGIITSLT